MTIYDPAPGPSRTSRITLPPMMMVPQTHHRPLNYNHDISQSSYLRHPYIAQAEYDYDYEFPANMSYRPDNDFQLPQDTSHAVEMQSTQINHDGSGPLSLSLLVAAAHAAQADISYANSPIHFTSSLPLSCELSTSGNYSPAVTSPDAQGNWPPVGLATSESDRLAPSPPQTPLATPDVIPRGEKPKQGRKKRSVGYVRPIIIHRKRVGQRLLDMLKSAPTPSKASSMEISRARCFPFADMKNKLRECTRRMRLDELDRLDKTLDGGEVRLKLSEEVLAEEPHRAGEFSVPSAGHTEEQSN
ncbi:hypothetical protein PTTG_12115 [Puccinia triticina 1-1 BBBD Race 1]|uniref:Uncharacterized protein n=1 Tax=Puccinia triticina (isolate 1-1 / race 1 (BBBD)) TaxID=630390 RepID=A0A180G2J6_PUCT1|nr:hypothetical protein PTTG_12115 [Puccinia triticina 1-1 BBBD Race 1]WAR55292.1 hypothetical protein PtB15_6B31 [Puccinia triticina]